MAGNAQLAMERGRQCERKGRASARRGSGEVECLFVSCTPVQEAFTLQDAQRAKNDVSLLHTVLHTSLCPHRRTRHPFRHLSFLFHLLGSVDFLHTLQSAAFVGRTAGVGI